MVHQLIDIVSKDGNLLLNIGPRSDGTIPEEVQQVLLDVGAWLNVNGEAIYGTRPWRIYGEGPTKVAAGSFHDTDTTRYTAEDFRFTTKGDVLYAIGLNWPATAEAVIHSLASNVGSQHVQSVTLLGSNEKLQFDQRADGLHAIRAFEVHAVDYLLKPYDKERFDKALVHARQVLEQRGEANRGLEPLLQSLRSLRPLERFVVKDKKRIFFVPVSNVLWIEATGNYACIHTASDSHLLRKTMAHLEEKLAPHHFIRVRKSAIVNGACISEIRPMFDGVYAVDPPRI